MTGVTIKVTQKELWAVRHLLGRLHDMEGRGSGKHTGSIHLETLVEGDVYDLCQTLKARIHGSEEY